eukprot:m.47598 g.47598  ORF g.47598 m.47598 type:complete len:362 (-) comp20532_c0_seq1:25-1110(-)
MPALPWSWQINFAVLVVLVAWSSRAHQTDDTIGIGSTQTRLLRNGKDFDDRVVNHLLNRLRRTTGAAIEPNSRGMYRLRLEVGRAIQTLSSHPNAHIEIENIVQGVDFNTILTRSLFEELTKDLMKDALESLSRVLIDAQLEKSDIDEIVLVGEYARIPKMQQLLKQFLLGKEPMQGIKPQQVVATGAAIQGHWLTADAHKDNMLVCFAVAPLSIGVETAGGVMNKLVLRNTIIPTKKYRAFSVAHADCSTCCTVNVRVFEGERAMVKDNKLLATLRVKSDRCQAYSEPQVEVTVEIDCDETLTVTIVDKGTHDRVAVTLPRDEYATQTPEDVERIVRESDRYAQQDQQSLDALVVVDEIE